MIYNKKKSHCEPGKLVFLFLAYIYAHSMLNRPGPHRINIVMDEIEGGEHGRQQGRATRDE